MVRSLQDVNSATVLLRDNVVRHRKTKARSFTGWLSREERVEHLFLDNGRDAIAVVANANFHCASQVLRGDREYRLEVGLSALSVLRLVAA